MDQRHDPGQMEIIKRVVANRARCFGGYASAPIGWIDPISDLQLFYPVDDMEEETAVADELVVLTIDHGELRWQTGAVPRAHPVDEPGGLFTPVDDQREPHEILVRHQDCHSIEIRHAE